VNLVTGTYAHRMTFKSDLGSVFDLVVKPNGSMAWDAYAEQGKTAQQTLRIADTRGLATSPG